MGQKDITQKNFEAYNDVFSDIVNGTLFDGREVIKSEALVDAMAKSQYKADDFILWYIILIFTKLYKIVCNNLKITGKFFYLLSLSLGTSMLI